jgi:acyl dehydratase
MLEQGGIYMPGSDQDKLIDEWVAKKNQRIGEIHIPRVGEYPPDMDSWYGTIMNEWVTTDTIRHFADGSGDRNPLWRSQDYARGTRWGGIIAPPTYTDHIIQPYSGSMREDEYIPRFETWFSLPYGSTRQLFRVIRPGDRFRAVQTYLGLKEIEPTRPGCRQFEETVRRTLINQREEIVAVHDRYMDVVVNFKVDDDHPYWMKRRKRRLTDKERDDIQRGYDEETRRGAEVLYWDDVTVGEEIKPLTVGPISVYDVAACYTAIPGHAVAFDLEWERIKLVPDFHWFDPDINFWTCGGICHFQDDKGHANIFDGGAAVGFYCQVEWVVGRMICNWMGDDGFVKKLDNRFPVYPIVGDVLRCQGRVTGKYLDGNEHLVDLDLVCKNQDGLVLMPGSATVRLPSRSD